MKKIILLIPLLFLLSGCVTPPQTTRELRDGIQRGAALTKIEKIEVNRSFTVTFNSIKRNTDKCLNVTATGSTPGRYGPVRESTRYNSSSNRTSDKTGETVLQMGKKATGKMPDGGYFVMLIDTEGVSSNKTRVTIYGPSIGYKNVFGSIFVWARGEKQKCPRFPMGGRGLSFKYHNK